MIPVSGLDMFAVRADGHSHVLPLEQSHYGER